MSYKGPALALLGQAAFLSPPASSPHSSPRAFLKTQQTLHFPRTGPPGPSHLTLDKTQTLHQAGRAM